MGDIVERLRRLAFDEGHELADEAAAEIRRLRAELTDIMQYLPYSYQSDRARAALKGEK